MSDHITLDETTLVRLYREEWDKKKKALLENVNSDRMILSPGLKVTHKETGLICTIDVISPNYVVLKKPEGPLFNVSPETLEKEYELS